ncbi:hypothetical protein TNCV_1763681 [Trichonephila clavipes]|nr:hypothetical protein TNCV_1763681 [Trichonephila clavipes]
MIPGMSCILLAVTDIRMLRSSTEGTGVHETLHLTRTRLTSPFVHTCRGRVKWNAPVRLCLFYNSRATFPLQSTGPYMIRTSRRSILRLNTS